MHYVEASEYRKLAQKKRPPKTTGVKFTSVAAPQIAADSRTFRFCFSDSSTDLQGDRLNADGWSLESYKSNPTVIWAHDASSPPVGRASNFSVEDGKLLGDVTFADTPFADELYQLVKGGFLRAVSVGFIPGEYKFSDDPDRAGGIDYIEGHQLLELSLCPVPANPRALIEAKSRGIPTSNLENWMTDRLGDKAISETERAVYKSLLNTKELDESDSSSGGFAVGNCGRDRDETCGMIDAAECTVHRDDEEYEGEEKLLMTMTNIVKEARAEIRRLNSEIKALRRTKAEDEADEHDGDDAEVHLSKGLAHIKAAEELHGSAVEHMTEAHKCFKAYHKSMDDGDGDEDDRPDEEDKDDDDDEIEKMKARAVARMSR